MPEYKITVDGKVHIVNIGRIAEDTVEVTLDGESFQVGIESPTRRISKTPVIKRNRQVLNAAEIPDRTSPPGTVTGGDDVVAPLPGLILKVLIKEGEAVSEGQPVAVMEAMKMENEIESHITGIVKEIFVKEGDIVLENALIMKVRG